MRLFNIKIIKKKFASDLGKDIGVTLIGQLLVMILAIAINKLLSNMLSVDGYGRYAIIKKSVTVLSFVMLSGMGIALPRYLSRKLEEKKNTQAKSIVMSSVLIVFTSSLIVITILVWEKSSLAKILIGNNEIKLYLSAVFYASSLTFLSLLYAYYRGRGLFRLFNISQVIVQITMTIAVFLFGYNLIFIFNIWTIINFGTVVLSLIIEFRKKKIYENYPVNWNQISPQLKNLSKYGLPRLGGDFILFSFTAFPLIFINWRINTEASSFFSVGLALATISNSFLSFLGLVLLPYVSKSIAQNKFSQVSKIITKIALINFGVSSIAILFLWFGINEFIILFFSDKYLPAANMARILVLTIFSESIYLLLRNPIDALSIIPYNTFNLLISFAILIVLFYFSNTLLQYAISYLIASFLKGSLSFLAWQFCKYKYIEVSK